MTMRLVVCRCGKTILVPNEEPVLVKPTLARLGVDKDISTIPGGVESGEILVACSKHAPPDPGQLESNV